MKNSLKSFWPVSVLVGFVLMASATRAEVTLELEAPKTLPRDTWLGGYSPALRLEYANVPKGRHRLKLWLLETSTGNYYCGSTQLCEREFKVDNVAGTNANGAVVFADNFDVYDYSGFLWVARLYAESGAEIASARLEAAAVAARPPTLRRVGDKSCVVGEELRFEVTATTNGPAVKFSARGLPPGAELNSDTGEFKWKPTKAGKFPGIIIEASISALGLTDAEVIEIEVKARK